VAGRIPKFWLLAALGFYWMPSGRVLWTVVAASVLVTALGLRRRNRPLPAAPVTDSVPAH